MDNESNNPNMQYKRNNKSKKPILVIVFIIVALFCVITAVIIFINSNRKLLPNDNDIIIDNNETLEDVDRLWYDFNNGLITADEYVRYNLYNLYDTSKLDKKYVSSTSLRVDDLITKYYDKLSEETLKLYIDYYSLPNLSFNVDSDKPKTEPMANTVADQKETTVNLNKAYLSPNGKFLVWYTTDGDSAVDFSKVEKCAELLERTTLQFDRMFGLKYSAKTTVMAEKGDRYKQQLSILKDSNIEEKYFKEAMHIYIYDLNSESTLASYISMDVSDNFWLKLGNSYFYESELKDGTIMNFYIVIDSNYISDDTVNYEDIVAHEMFHHYQSYIIDNDNTGNRKTVKDGVISEATPQWAAAKVSENKLKNNNLNNWVSNYLGAVNNLFTEMYNNYGLKVGYAMANFLYTYENNVSDGLNKILNSIHAEDAFKYLNDNSTVDERIVVMKELALKNLTNDYSNNNYLPLNNESVKLKRIVTSADYSSQVNLSAVGIDYYLLNDKYNYEIKVSPVDYNSMSAYLIGYLDGEYIIISSHLNTWFSITTDNYYNYDKLYLVIVNNDFKNHIDYKITIDQTGKKTLKVKEEIEKNSYSSENTALSAFGIDCYSLSNNYNYEVKISSLGDNPVSVYLLKKEDGKYKTISSYLNKTEEISIVTDNYYEDKLYLVITSPDIKKPINYKININQTGLKTIKNTQEFNTNFNNYRIKATTNMLMYGMETTTYIDGVVDELHQKEYLKTTTQVLGMGFEIGTYVDFHNGYTYTQNPLTGTWEKTAGATSLIDLSIILDKFKETGNVTEVNKDHYLVKLEKDDIQGLLKYNGTLSEYKLEGEIFVNVYIKDNYVSKLEYDFSNLIAEIEKFNMTIEFYDHNKAGDVSIPVEVAG